jgi:3-methyl-2-oxobutanoate hydroxymethyltransferase
MRITINDIKQMKVKKEKIAMITAYDYTTAKLVDESGIPLILVGDSLGMVMLGYESTIPVTIDEMIHHTKAVVRGTKKSLIIGDMPFMTYHTTVTDAIKNAARFIQEGGAQAIKLEGGEVVADTVKHLVDRGIPVMGHLGLTPQFIHQLGGFKAQGKTPAAAKKLINDAIALEQAGAFGVVLEVVPAQVAKLITESIGIPTIGIGAGPYCDGQVQVVHDMLGLYTDFVPKHAKQFARLADTMKTAFQSYNSEVKAGSFPAKENYNVLDDAAFAEVQKYCASDK